MTESIDIYGTCDTISQPSIDETNELLMVLGTFNRDFAMGADIRMLFEGLLSNFLKLTKSEYGFIGERLIRPSGEPFLKTHAITNIAWDETTQIFYDEHAPKGMEFNNLDTLFGHVLRTGNTSICNDPATDPHSGGIPNGHPALNTFMGIPLTLGDKYLGMVGIANRPGGYDAQLVGFLEPLISITVALVHAAQQQKMASHDPLTGLANRRMFDERYSIEASRHERHGYSLSVLMIDIDNFKMINDSFGHPVGDRCLIHIAEILENRVRTEDVVARCGGEEFAVLLPDTSAQQAAAVAEQLRIAVSAHPFSPTEIHESIKMTVSIGVTTILGKEKSSYDEIMRRVDRALYTAKSQGRNQVCIASSEVAV